MPDPATGAVDNLPNSLADPVATIGESSPIAPRFELSAADRYRLGEEIARGGMGIIYRATDTVLGREVAVKVLSDKFGPASAAARRFADEARITAQLQHPAIPPVHDLGTLPDGRPFLAMKLIKGDTLDDLLTERGTPDDNRSRLLAVFEGICQAVGYAHSRGVIHRDLKPSNVMVGAFGEVQVMDWGLARAGIAGQESEDDQVETRHVGGSTTPNPQAGEAVTLVLPGDTPPSRETRAGSIVGTPGYMPPEQARGTEVDARADVFALGAILCEVLTGHPPWGHGEPSVVVFRAARAILEPTLALLDACGSEPELVALCKHCLSPHPSQRPTNGGEVAAAIGDIRTAAEERARQAALARVKAEAEAHEQRKRRKVQLALAAALGLLLLGGAGFAWYRAEQRTEQTRVEGDRDREEQAKTETLNRVRARVRGLLAVAAEQRNRYQFRDAKHTLAEAHTLAAGKLTPDLMPTVAGAEADLAFVEELDRIRLMAITSIEWAGGKTRFNMKAVPPAYLAAFRERGFDLLAANRSELARWVKESPIRTELVAALDYWSLFEPDPLLRAAILATAREAAEPHPWSDALRDPAVRASPAGLWWVTRHVDPRTLHPTSLITGALILKAARLGTSADRLLARGQNAHPTDFWLVFMLGKNARNSLARLAYFRAARVIRPDHPTLLSDMGVALAEVGDTAGAAECYREALRLDPNLAAAHLNLGNLLKNRGDLKGAIVAHRKAVELDETDPAAHYSLARSLSEAGEHDSALIHNRRAAELDPNDAAIQSNLGVSLYQRDDMKGAAYRYRLAILLDPKYAQAHYNLGRVYERNGNSRGAIDRYREAIKADPKLANAYLNLGKVLLALGDLEGSIAASREAIRLDPAAAIAHSNLGTALQYHGELDEAVACHREAVRLLPDFATGHFNLGNALRQAGDRAGAIGVYRRVLRLDWSYLDAHVNMSNALKDEGALDDGIQCLREAIAIDPTHTIAQYNLGVALKQKGDIDGAIAAFLSTLQIDRSDASAYFNLGLAFQARGNLDAAVGAFRAALQLRPGYRDYQRKLNHAIRARDDRLAPPPREVKR